MEDYYGFFTGAYAQGATTSTAGKPLIDGNIDQNASSFPKEIRKQTHWLNVNDTNLPSIITTNTNKTIGISVSVQVNSKSETFNKEAEDLIIEFSKIGVGELTGRHHFNKSLRVMCAFDLIDGGFIVRHHYNILWKIPYKYELVGVDMIDTSKTQLTFKQDREETTINGLVRNKWGQITHVWIYNTEDKRKSTKVKYDNLTYFSDTWISIDQQTAVSKLTSMLKTLDQNLQYGSAELDSAIEAAKAGVYLQSQAYNEVMQVVSDTIKNKIPNANSAADISKAMDLVTPVMRQLGNIGIKPKGVTPIASGDNIIDGKKSPDSQYKELNSNTQMKMASSIGYSSVGAYKDLISVNYSGIKAGIEMDQITADIKFDDYKNVIIDEILSRLMLVGIQIGRIKERVAYLKNPYNFNKFECLRKNKINMEPSKNATADKTTIALGTDTEANIIETRHGVKYESWLKKKQDQADLKYDIELKAEIRNAQKRKTAFEKAGIEDPEMIEQVVEK